MFLKLALAISVFLQGADDLAKHLGVNEPYEAFRIFNCNTQMKKPAVRFIAWEADLVFNGNLLTVHLLDKKKKPFVAATLKNCKQIGVTAIAIRKFSAGNYDKAAYIRRINAR